MKQIVDSRAFIWIMLALPAIPMMGALMSGATQPDGTTATEFLLHPTGETSARLIIIAMILTPLRMLFPKARFWAWMMRRRRYFGVAAFGYALLHTVLYVVHKGNLEAILGEFLVFGILTGWLAFFIFVPLALTSNDTSVKAMGRGWKTLQRGVYAAAVLTLLHWIFVHNQFGPAMVHFVPLALLEGYRIWRNLQAGRTAVASS